MSSKSEKWVELWNKKPINKYTLTSEQKAWLERVKKCGDSLIESIQMSDLESKNARKYHEECLAFLALNDLLPKYYDWVRENFVKDIIKKAGV